MNFTKSIIKHIDKLVGALRQEDELKEILKRKLTKKEFKVFISVESNILKEQIAQDINSDIKRVDEIYKSVCKKLNQEKVKKELVQG